MADNFCRCGHREYDHASLYRYKEFPHYCKGIIFKIPPLEDGSYDYYDLKERCYVQCPCDLFRAENNLDYLARVTKNNP